MKTSTPIRAKLGAIALAGIALALSACDSTEPKDITTDEQKAAFRSECTSKGGKLNETTCKGTSTCVGLYLNGETGKKETTTCKGTNNCAGIQCLDTTVKVVDSAAAKAAARTALLAAKSEAEFRSACTMAGATPKSEATCAGHNSCAGVRFLSGSSKTESTSCSGHGSCKGLSCPI